jgi:hypothetical protein
LALKEQFLVVLPIEINQLCTVEMIKVEDYYLQNLILRTLTMIKWEKDATVKTQQQAVELSKCNINLMTATKMMVLQMSLHYVMAMMKPLSLNLYPKSLAEELLITLLISYIVERILSHQVEP